MDTVTPGDDPVTCAEVVVVEVALPELQAAATRTTRPRAPPTSHRDDLGRAMVGHVGVLMG
jgi:hypothetical protein